MRVLIVGGGIGGLTAALALRQRGFDVAVFERSATLAEIGAGFHCSPNGVRVLLELGLGDELAQVGVRLSGREVRLWNTGKSWHLPDHGDGALARYGAPYFLLHRGDLHALLVRALDRASPGSIRTSAPCVGVQGGPASVSASFADGSTAAGDVLIGADGVHSVVRRLVFRDEPATFTGNAAWRGLVELADLPPHLRSDATINWIGPNGSVTHYPVRRGRLLNFVAMVRRSGWVDESWTQPGRREDCYADFAGWHPDVHRIIERIERPYIWGLFMRPPLQTWAHGRIALLGDACHPMLPYLGQGANMAIEDACVLARSLETHAGDPPRALTVYEATRAARATRVVEKSVEQSYRVHDAALADEASAEAYAARNWDPDSTRQRYDWIFQYDACTVPLADR